MIDRETIQSAKDVDLNIILDEFNWEKDSYGRIRCPDHDDKNPSCAYDTSKNKFRCFACGESFDSIDLYQCLCEKVNGRAVPFYKAVKEILELDTMANGSNGSTGIASSNSHWTGYQSSNHKTSQTSINNGIKANSPYEMIINNSRPLTGYELNYLHSRGIMLYDSYVYLEEVYTAQNVEKALQTATDQHEINRLDEIKSNGTFYKGISPILKENRIQIKHNYWEGVNSIIYLIDYEADDCDDLCLDQFYMDSERHMAIQKNLDGNHIKRALGTSDFNFITKGFEYNKSRDIYICEGMEDALSYAMNGIRSISLNSTANLKSLIHYLSEDYLPGYTERFVISFDHDESGQRATQELKGFFEAYNQNPPRKRKYDYAVCAFPHQFHDINDYWKSRVFGQGNENRCNH